MAKRSLERDEAKKIYLDYKGNITASEIGKKVNKSPSTVRSWKSKDNWDNELKKITKKKRGGQKGNRNAIGNSGGGAPIGNQNRLVHGFYSELIPDDVQELVEKADEGIIEMLESNIKLQYAGILRGQKIMHVKDEEDHTKILKKTKEYDSEGSSSREEEWNIYPSFEKHGLFLDKQAKAVNALMKTMETYEDMKNIKTKAEIEKLKAKKLKMDIQLAKNKTDSNTKDTQIIIQSAIPRPPKVGEEE